MAASARGAVFLAPSPPPCPCLAGVGCGRCAVLGARPAAACGIPARLSPRSILASALASSSRGLVCAPPSPPSSALPRAAPWVSPCRCALSRLCPPSAVLLPLLCASAAGASAFGALGSGCYAPARPSPAVLGLASPRGGACAAPPAAGFAVGSSPRPPARRLVRRALSALAGGGVRLARRSRELALQSGKHGIIWGKCVL